MIFIYILLSIIAVGVLLLSKIGKTILSISAIIIIVIIIGIILILLPSIMGYDSSKMFFKDVMEIIFVFGTFIILMLGLHILNEKTKRQKDDKENNKTKN